MASETPLMTQYKEIKEEYQNAILLFRLGDFYEMFFEDAKIASKELGLTLTSRNREKGQDVPLAGVPYHSVASYVAKLLEKGYTVAVCDQVEDPKAAKGIVKREVTRVLTPGTQIDIDYLDGKSNQYLMSFVCKEEKAAIAYFDITTGEFRVREFEEGNIFYQLLGELGKVNPKELILEEEVYRIYQDDFEKYPDFSGVKINFCQNVRQAESYLKDCYHILSLESFGLEQKVLAQQACANILDYVTKLQKGQEFPLMNISLLSNQETMELNRSGQKNLEIFGALFSILDLCKTSMGSRYLKRLLQNPLLDISKIRKRQDYVEFFTKEVLLREEVRELLSEVYDLERIIGKIQLSTVNGRDIVALGKSLQAALLLEKQLRSYSMLQMNREIFSKLQEEIANSISSEAPFSIREGGIFRTSYHKELDELRHIASSGKEILLEIEAREREKTGIKTLKIKYNKVFGYFIEVSKANEHLVPSHYIRKQTLVNSERYIVEELKEYEDRILNAKTKIESLEYYLFQEFVGKIKEKKEELLELAKQLSFLDVMTSFAQVAIQKSYVRPEVLEEDILEIRGGRHPIVESLIPKGSYVKNDLYFDRTERMMVLTGPNMSGKSTYMKQIALIIILAQVGSFVPADFAKIGIVDKIFTRIGASDDLLTGQSTFMVEMSEVANIVHNATEKSFIILDEIGRGTSTFDGISIATAITEYIHSHIRAKTIFATHYHELTELEKKLELVKNYRIEVRERGKEVLFLREIVQGGADKSYGIEVAKLSGLPQSILKRSKQILSRLEKQKALVEKKMQGEQMMLFQSEEMEEEEEAEFHIEEQSVLEEIRNVSIEQMTPLQALVLLQSLKGKLSGGKHD
ncbi:DNA mismatch repair protein MutS [Fusobacterium necrophorum subsp. funduliforme ATCC 51357]|uniref:DNA mismatch repair protein MutS n=1 Tax=Fusobacterium necrophorum subsp. funduliforme TaxID=143387 RepID=A0A170MVQ5_9FUSO|nr:DNA mismatch repair protein MutS [Fusobacterium necrophorum]AYV92279.1 DNA mismatch repair protein MutS [Fusobacterium necrophorum subsp. funduliforme]EIJ72003.1 DNA mismatch repair protein MutS [Fusobacterium necrophorum subsp. funduliforme ATCC 51357]KAB0553603.1 DNA mismatch repair protein MutS [Fusobacterium necrophorum subsp. funduliforme]KYL03524.1 DNA mismatch repair protein MutS [Fusobacterium necrophorum subsp. funduliforme]KYM43118.1 DNA mismatch repair protein MutS [Fusobacterium